MSYEKKIYSILVMFHDDFGNLLTFSLVPTPEQNKLLYMSFFIVGRQRQ